MFVEPTVYDEVEQSVYEELWDTARMLTESEIKPYARFASYANKKLTRRFLFRIRGIKLLNNMYQIFSYDLICFFAQLDH